MKVIPVTVRHVFDVFVGAILDWVIWTDAVSRIRRGRSIFDLYQMCLLFVPKIHNALMSVIASCKFDNGSLPFCSPLKNPKEKPV